MIKYAIIDCSNRAIAFKITHISIQSLLPLFYSVLYKNVMYTLLACTLHYISSTVTQTKSLKVESAIF